MSRILTKAVMALLFIFLTSCNPKTAEHKIQSGSGNEVASLQKWNAFKDYLLHRPVLRDEYRHHPLDTSILFELHKGDTNIIVPFADIDKDGTMDSIFSLFAFFYNDSSKEYSFYDRYIFFSDYRYGMIKEDIQPCDWPYPSEDIDEDGILEVFTYSSSCASRYKSIDMYSFKKGEWKKQGSVEYDIIMPGPDIRERVVKTGKGTFKMRSIYENTDEWVSFEIKY